MALMHLVRDHAVKISADEMPVFCSREGPCPGSGGPEGASLPALSSDALNAFSRSGFLLVSNLQLKSCPLHLALANLV